MVVAVVVVEADRLADYKDYKEVKSSRMTNEEDDLCNCKKLYMQYNKQIQIFPSSQHGILMKILQKLLDAVVAAGHLLSHRTAYSQSPSKCFPAAIVHVPLSCVRCSIQSPWP